MGLHTLPTELLEAILIHVQDMQTLLLAQQVCCQWASCIQQSPELQKALFFQPTSPNKPAQQNPLLASKFPFWFPADDPKSCAIAFGAGDMQDFLDSNDAFRRPTASWRRMLVQQPPIMSLGGVERGIAPSDMVSMRRWEIPLQPLGGLRMNALYDLIIHASGDVPRYYFFRVCWARYRTYAGLQVSPPPNPDPAGFYDRRHAVPLRNALTGTEVVLDMWYSEQLPTHLWSGFKEERWTGDLVRGLQLPMEDVKVDLLQGMRELKEANGWSMSAEMNWAGPHPLPHELGWDL
ncbi:uncharacterized protein N7482_001303 [Penicillium canariense]|uniref:F-box domain-containing protein n=1 Tax=Penicillium canariense TaxID=189055 RepID=A0A9W9IGW2_9EURO|nr:uncharacterized protein N7482_001303 [Penicillium canariense]KAJ5175426.1 hypothetical protein N7482_001303 [Penicillium canariense]